MRFIDFIAATLSSANSSEDIPIVSNVLRIELNAILFANYAAILLRLDRVDEALKNADHAIELDPKWAKAYYRRGEALRRLNALLPAVVSLSEGVALDPSNKLIAELQIDVSQQLFKHFPLKRLQNVGLDHDRFTVLTMTGQELAAAGHHREAQIVLSRALSLHTPSLRLRESAVSSLASVHFLLGEFTQATLLYQQQLEIRLQLDGPPAEVHDNVATSAEAAGNHALALSHRKQKLEFLDDVDKKRLETQIRIGKGVVHASMVSFR
ncbi:unnamed protein product [Strongylus vulgaris]|uniref:MalT-like TPR region domain-containing protein n=1 Tax=Strongylus vulgaris TaxID=40348 RepID=A0A3P7L5T0_STRVU|nr:unnamed protein product [Strongylus vulgaris]